MDTLTREHGTHMASIPFLDIANVDLRIGVEVGGPTHFNCPTHFSCHIDRANQGIGGSKKINEKIES